MSYDLAQEPGGSAYRHLSEFVLCGEEEAAGGVLTAKQAPAGPAPPRRSVCAPAAMSRHCTADRLPEQETRAMRFT